MSIAFVFIFQCACAQTGMERYKTDTLHVFSAGQLTYEFHFAGPSEGLYFDRFIYSGHPPRITLKIINNTADTIINRYKERDSRLSWIREGGRSDTLRPGECMTLWSGWNGHPQPAGMINSPVNLNYSIRGDQKSQIINIWGELYPDDYAPAENKKETLPDTSETTPQRIYYIDRKKGRAIDPIDTSGVYRFHVFIEDLERQNPGKTKEALNVRCRGLAAITTAPEGLGIHEKDRFYILLTKPENVAQVRRLLNNVDLHMMTNSHTYLDDTYHLFFSPGLNWTKQQVADFLKEKGIAKYEAIKSFEEWKALYPHHYSYAVKIKLDNADQKYNLDLINDLRELPEMEWITFGIRQYDVLDQD